jgi:hypothetical protein
VLWRAVLELLGHLNQFVIEARRRSSGDFLVRLLLLLLLDPVVKVFASVLAKRCLKSSVEGLVRSQVGELAQRGHHLVEGAVVGDDLNMLSDRLSGVARRLGGFMQPPFQPGRHGQIGMGELVPRAAIY